MVKVSKDFFLMFTRQIPVGPGFYAMEICTCVGGLFNSVSRNTSTTTRSAYIEQLVKSQKSTITAKE